MAKIKMKLSEMTLDQLRAKQARIEKIIDKRMQERLALLASIPAPIGAWTVDDNDGLSDFEGIEVLHDQYSFLNDDGDAGVTPILPRTTRMKITIVTLHRVEMEEHFVGAVEGSLADEQRRKLADQYGATYNLQGESIGNTEEALDAAYDEPDDEDRDEIFFREVDLCKDPSALVHLMNIDDDGITLNEFANHQDS